MKDYVLKILLPFQSTDDPDARRIATGVLAAFLRDVTPGEIRLLEVYKDRPARPVHLNTDNKNATENQ